MFSLLHAIFAILQLALAFWAFRLYRQRPNWAILALIAIAVGLAYDNAVVASGIILGVGDTLKTLSIPRFAIHAFLTPLMLLVGLYIAREAGIAWAQKPLTMQITLGITLLLIAVGVMQGLVGIDLVPACHNGTLRYAERISESQLCSDVAYSEEVLARKGMPPMASIATIIGLVILGGFVWRKANWQWMALAAIAMFITAAIPPSVVGLWLGNGGELLLVLGMVASVAFVLKPRLVTA